MTERRRWCICSRATRNLGQSRAECFLHGDTAEAKAYQDGLADAAHAAAPDTGHDTRQGEQPPANPGHTWPCPWSYPTQTGSKPCTCEVRAATADIEGSDLQEPPC